MSGQAVHFINFKLIQKQTPVPIVRHTICILRIYLFINKVHAWDSANLAMLINYWAVLCCHESQCGDPISFTQK